jgi:hypothetical protein
MNSPIAATRAVAASALLVFTFTQSSGAADWPQSAPSPAGEVSVYQPQLDSFEQTQMTGRAAVSVTPSGSSTPTFGAIWFTATISTDRDTRTVQLISMDVTKSRFPEAEGPQAAQISQAIDQAASGWNLTLSLDQLLASLAQTQQQQTAAANLNNAPPQIIFSDSPAVLVTIDGPPKLVQVENSPLMRVVNTPFFLVLDPPSQTYYLHGGANLWASAKAVEGPWQTAQNVPISVATLAATQSQSSATDPTQPDSSTAGAQANEFPRIIVATQPTELIVFAGQPEYTPIENTNLLDVSNTDSDVFRDIDNQLIYVLLSGRWYSASVQTGPWTYVAASQLPADFSRIPPGSPKADALVSVPQTQPAKDAVLNAAVPQTAPIRRDAPPPTVTYDGSPKFEPVEGVSLKYAVNTSSQVLEVAGSYYCCSDGVWYLSSSEEGAWAVATSIPDEIYLIPPSNPLYNVTYCYIYQSTPEFVYCGYLPGYTGSYVFDGAVVYGTGWNYAPWYGSFFIPRPMTWGFAAVYNPFWHGWGFGWGWGSGWGAAWWGGGWHGGWGGGWWGAGGWHGANWNRNVNINRTVNRNVNINRNVTNNIYNRNTNRIDVNHQSVVNRDNRQAQRTQDQRQADRDADRQTDRQQDRQQGRQAARQDDGKRNDVYADHNGNVYRHSLDGWQQRDNGNWRNADQQRSDDASRERDRMNSDWQDRSRSDDFRGGRGWGGGGRMGGGGGGRGRR